MGRKSTRINKNAYQLSREEAGLTREAAAEALQFISADRIDRIEREVIAATPEDVRAMAACYKDPSLCNYYCSHECPIGQDYVPEVRIKSLSQITLEMLSTLNHLAQQKERFIEISADGRIDPEEEADFREIRDNLSQMSMAIDSLELWFETRLSEQGGTSQSQGDTVRN